MAARVTKGSYYALTATGEAGEPERRTRLRRRAVGPRRAARASGAVRSMRRRPGGPLARRGAGMVAVVLEPGTPEAEATILRALALRVPMVGAAGMLRRRGAS